LTLGVRREPSGAAGLQVDGPEIPDATAIDLGAHEGERPPVGRPAGNRRETVAADTPNVVSVRVGDIDRAFAVPIRVERDLRTIG
jgi:hypothetical protein